MRFKIDENLPRDLADALIALGHTADTVQEEGLAGASDPDVLSAAIKDGRILLTLDKGFANVISYPPESHPGIILFRPGSLERPACWLSSWSGYRTFFRCRLTVGHWS